MIDLRQTFHENEIFLTGANGFLGKVVLALLLDRYPGCRGIHVLVRPRKGRSAEERFEREVLQSPAFEPLLAKFGREALLKKITVWAGDAAEPDCGIQGPGPWERARLILHCAGLVEFFPPADEALRANVDALDQLTATARRSGARLLHVSTCYVAGKADGLIEETEPIAGFYPLRRGPDDRSFDHGAELAEARRQLARLHGRNARIEYGRQRARRWGWVNTYTWSKSLAEQMLAAAADVPHTIVRPAIVESAWRFPVPGWIEGGRTAAPLVLMALGGMKDWPARPDLSLEIVPVDLVAAAALVAGALLIEGKAHPVYQLATSDVNPFPMRELLPLLTSEAARDGAAPAQSPFPFWLNPPGRLRFLSMEAARAQRELSDRRREKTERMLAHMARSLRHQRLPGRHTFERWSAAMRTARLQSRFREQVMDQYLPFILENRYIFEAHNIREAVQRIQPEDRRRLPWNPETIDWAAYWRDNQIPGIRRWVQPEAVRAWSFQI